jgi:hypothetical protein
MSENIKLDRYVNLRDAITRREYDCRFERLTEQERIRVLDILNCSTEKYGIIAKE